jgi:23S rRNA (adenine2503-C2)-methyltransferase
LSQDVTDLRGCRPCDIERHLAAVGSTISAAQARRIFAHAVGRGQPLATLPRLDGTVRQQVDTRFERGQLAVVERVRDDDGFEKYLLRSPDGALSEAVCIPLSKPGRYSVCLSSQIGCAMKCDFCATGRLGLTRNLEAWEMVAAFDHVRAEVAKEPGARVTGAVFMGQGEPFQNYDAVIRAAQILSHPNGGGIAQKAITISTVGVVPAMRRYTEEGHRYRLIVSVHSVDAACRRRLLPVVGKQPVDELFEAIAAHAASTGQPVTLAWTLLGGINDGVEEARELRRRLGETPAIINLIDVNDAREDGYRRSTEAELETFRDALASAGLSMRRRYSGGRARHAACGMLAGQRRGSA